MPSLFENLISELQLFDSQLVQEALTHKSYTIDFPDSKNYERLEFLGDAVLKMVFSEYLHHKFPQEDEGNLSKYRSRLISDDLLSTLAQKIGLDLHLRIGNMLKGQRTTPKSIYGDALEALIGVIYLERDYQAAKKFILVVWEADIDQAIQESVAKNYKALLIEKIQGKYGKPPSFKTMSSSGKAHDMNFVIGVYFDEQFIASGQGKSKKIAGQEAAKAALNNLSKLN